MTSAAGQRPAFPTGWAFFATRTTLSLRTYLTILPVALAAAALAVPGASGSVMMAWLGAGVLAEVVVGAVFLVGWVALGRSVTHRPAVTRVAVAVTVLVAYALRGLLLVVATHSFDVPDTTSPVLRVLASALNMSLWTLLVGAMWQARDHYRRELRAAGERLARVRAERGTATDGGEIDLPLRDELTSVQGALTGLLDRFGDSDPDVWAEDLQRAIDHELRPLSHRLMAPGMSSMSRWGRVRQILWRASGQPVALLPLAVVLIVVIGVNALLRYPPSDAAVVILLYLPLISLSLLATHAARRTRLPGAVANLLLLITAAGLTPVLLALVVETVLPRQPDLAGPLGVVLASGSVVVIAAIVQAARSVAADRMRDIREGIDALDVVQEERCRAAEILGRETGTYLHNVVQSRLTAVRLEASADPSSISSSSLAETRGLVTAAGASMRLLADPLVELEQAMRSWSGVITVTLSVAPEVDRAHPGLRRLCSFAQEAVANAVRHGEATAVAVEVSREVTPSGDPHMTCRVVDNGTWRYSGDPGIGLTANRDLMIAVDTAGPGTSVTASTCWG